MSPHTAITQVLLAASLLACGDSVTYIECPVGTRPEGSACIPLDPPDTSPEPDTSVADTVTPDTSPSPDTVSPGDSTGPIDVIAPQPTGSPCARNAECLGGTCLDWTGGYCTSLDCDNAPCALGDICLPFSGNHICTRPCASDGDCGSPDQACKRLETEDGIVGVCVGVDTDAGGTSAPCADPTDCAGAAACLASFPGGYCAVIGCPESRCALDAACVRIDDLPSCLLTCGSDSDCNSRPNAERRCGTLQSIANAPVDVCISGVEGKALGESCRTAFECSSGTCQVLGEGRCSQTGRPCFRASAAADCRSNEFCQVNAESRVGVCSQPCGPGARSCPGASHCVAEGAKPDEAWCRPACTGVTDTTCNGLVGLRCTYGIPVSDSGQGRYACSIARPGSPQADCESDATCAGGSCLEDGSEGYCTSACGVDAHCPFGGTCLFGAADTCMRACFSSIDCPAGFTCTTPSGAQRPVCMP